MTGNPLLATSTGRSVSFMNDARDDGATALPGPATLRLNMTRYRQLVKERGWGNVSEQSRRLGLSQPTLHRFHRCPDQTPGPRVVAALHIAFPGQIGDLLVTVPVADRAMESAA